MKCLASWATKAFQIGADVSFFMLCFCSMNYSSNVSSMQIPARNKVQVCEASCSSICAVSGERVACACFFASEVLRCHVLGSLCDCAHQASWPVCGYTCQHDARKPNAFRRIQAIKLQPNDTACATYVIRLCFRTGRTQRHLHFSLRLAICDCRSSASVTPFASSEHGKHKKAWHLQDRAKPATADSAWTCCAQAHLPSG